MNLSFRLKRSGRPEPSNHQFPLLLTPSGHVEYWFPVLPLTRQIGETIPYPDLEPHEIIRLSP